MRRPALLPTLLPTLLLTLLLTLAARPALAHAILVASTPAPNAHIKPGPLAILLRYNSRIDTGRCKVTLQAPDRTTTRLPTTAGAGPDQLTASTTLSPGAYILRWQVLAVDGHITRGDVRFTVDAP
jgi:methionine-rich copper-binding protein CopC